MNRDLESEAMALVAENKKLSIELGNLNSRVMDLRKNLERETQNAINLRVPPLALMRAQPYVQKKVLYQLAETVRTPTNLVYSINRKNLIKRCFTSQVVLLGDSNAKYIQELDLMKGIHSVSVSGAGFGHLVDFWRLKCKCDNKRCHEQVTDVLIIAGINDCLFHHTTFTTMMRQWEELKEIIRKNFKQQVSLRLVTSTTFRDFRPKSDQKNHEKWLAFCHQNDIPVLKPTHVDRLHVNPPTESFLFKLWNRLTYENVPQAGEEINLDISDQLRADKPLFSRFLCKKRNLLAVRKTNMLQSLLIAKNTLLETECILDDVLKVLGGEAQEPEEKTRAKPSKRKSIDSFAAEVVEKAAPRMRLDIGRSGCRSNVIKRIKVTITNNQPHPIDEFFNSTENIRAKWRTDPTGRYTVLGQMEPGQRYKLESVSKSNLTYNGSSLVLVSLLRKDKQLLTNVVVRDQPQSVWHLNRRYLVKGPLCLELCE